MRSELATEWTVSDDGLSWSFPPQAIEMDRFDGYWDKAPTQESASYLAAGLAETRALPAESGDADLVVQLL